MDKDAIAKMQAAKEAAFGGKLNIYTCTLCRGHIVTRDVDEGVTPFMTDCHATPGCKGPMQSSMYRVFDVSMRESHQWYRPQSFEGFSQYTRAHLEKGGLILRKAVFADEPDTPQARDEQHGSVGGTK